MSVFVESRFPLARLGSTAEIQLGKMLQPEPSSSFDVEVPYFRAGSISSMGFDSESPTMWCSPADLLVYEVREGDLLVTEGGDVGRIGWAKPTLSPTIIQNSLHRIRSARGDIRFVAYALQAVYSSGWLDFLCNKSTFAHLTVDKLSSLAIPFPKNAIQTSIADYLDAETARIDALIEKKQLSLVLLDEWEQRWNLDHIGDWRSTRSRTLRQFGATVLTGPFGTVLSADEYVEGGIPLINPTHISRGVITPESHVSVAPEVADRIRRHRLRQGDLVMGRKGDVGKAAVVGAREDGWLCGSDSIAIRCEDGDLRPEYLALALTVDLYRQQLAKHSTGATLMNVNEGILLGLRLPDTSRARQEDVVAASRSVSETRDGLTLRLRSQIELLAERRQAMITSSVTGTHGLEGTAA